MMRLVLLEGARMADREALHRELQKAFRFPDYYGNNLDALRDCLYEQGDVQVCFSDHREMIRHLGDYGRTALALLREAAESRRGFHLLIR